MAGPIVRVAALADLHCSKTSHGAFQTLFARVSEAADIVVIAGDLTDYGLPEVMDELMQRLSVSRRNLQSDICYGTILSREQYLHDIDRGKYRDARLQPEGRMTEDQIRIWSAGIRN